MTPTKALHEVGTLLWGEAWPYPIAKMTGVNPRTLQRCFTANARGEEHPAAAGVLNGLQELLNRVDEILNQT